MNYELSQSKSLKNKDQLSSSADIQLQLLQRLARGEISQ